MNNSHSPQVFFFADIWDIPEKESIREQAPNWIYAAGYIWFVGDRLATYVVKHLCMAV